MTKEEFDKLSMHEVLDLYMKESPELSAKEAWANIKEDIALTEQVKRARIDYEEEEAKRLAISDMDIIEVPRFYLDEVAECKRAFIILFEDIYADSYPLAFSGINFTQLYNRYRSELNMFHNDQHDDLSGRICQRKRYKLKHWESKEEEDEYNKFVDGKFKIQRDELREIMLLKYGAKQEMKKIWKGLGIKENLKNER